MKFVKHIAIFCLFGFSAAIARETPPDIVFIMADDLGKKWIGCYGAEDIRTPNIDALAKGGMKFNNAWSMPLCTPSSIALLTGTYPWRNGWVNTEKKIDELYDLVKDPFEKINLLAISDLTADQQVALKNFQAVVDSLPDEDTRPLCEPRAENPWDKNAAKGRKRK